MHADRRRLARRLRRLKGRRNELVARQGLARVEAHIAESAAQVAARRELVPPSPPETDLPIASHKQEIIDAIASSQCVIVCGETGSGKTTQLPRYCLEAGRGVFGTIAHTQPRRVAARSVAARIAAEFNTKPGGIIGHQVRFDRSGGRGSLVTIMTDGMLLAHLGGDPRLERYDTVILDEAHERSVNIDFLLGVVHRLLVRRPELRLIITSATIDAERFSKHFGGVPVIEVSGRTFPVEIAHAPAAIDLEGPDAISRAVVEAVRQADGLTRHDGDTLVFLPGEREIRACVRRLEGVFPDRQVLPLYARLSMAAQERVLRTSATRRIICSTNVAETSLTVPSIRAVVDVGLARVGRWSAKRHVQRLPVEPISQASAVQRAGRAGRVAPGVCIRLYREDDLAQRPEELEPEIRRTDLAGVLLRMAQLELGDPFAFPFLDGPRRTSVHEAQRLLDELGATESGKLTPVGREMADLPVEPRVARMLLAARDGRCLDAVLVIAAGLAIPDPRLRPPGQESQADAAHRALTGAGDSDFLGLYRLWKHLVRRWQDDGSSATRRWCVANHLSWVRMLEWRDIHGQLRRALRTPGLLHAQDPPVRPGPVHRALLSGLISHIGRRTDEGDYEGPSGRRFHVHPSSVLAREKPLWVMAGELVETSRLWARTCAAIHPSWIARVAPHLVNRRYNTPRWDARRGFATAVEEVSLRGLVVSKGRRVNLEPIDPDVARSVFIDHVFVNGRDDLGVDAIAESRAARRIVESAEDRLRTRTLLLPPHRREEIWDQRLPAHVIGMKSLQSWLRGASREEANSLRLRPQELVRNPQQDLYDSIDYPDTIDLGCGPLRLSYRFAEGESDDGLTIDVPLAKMWEIDLGQAEWLVPGIRRLRIEAILRGLPKDVRRGLVPLHESVKCCCEALAEPSGDFYQRLAEAASRAAGVSLNAAECRRIDLEEALIPRWRIVAGGQVVATGRDLGATRRQLRGLYREAMESAGTTHPLSSQGHVVWDMDDVPAETSMQVAGEVIPASAVLVDRGNSVDVEVQPRRGGEAASHRLGVRRLVAIALQGELAAAFEASCDFARMGLFAARWGGEARVRRDAHALAVELAGLGEADVRTARAFRETCDHVWAGIAGAAVEAGERLERVFEAALQVDRALAQRSEDDPLRMEAEAMMRRLLEGAFLVTAKPAWLARVPVWLRAIGGRLARPAATSDVDMDPWDQVVDRALAGDRPMTPSAAQMMCLLEEYRAARHGTKPQVPVTPEVLREQWNAVLRDAAL